MDVGELEAALSETRYRMQPPKFPAVARDITLIVDRSLEARSVLAAVDAMELDLFESIQLFDVFTGDPVPAGKRSLSFRLTYRSAERTLEDQEVNALHQFVTQRLLAAFQATLSGG
jgi:phenylalanyl-tRNA synthetase beta chain